MSGSWVTISTVMPRSRFSPASSSMISRPRWVSRLPVGSRLRLRNLSCEVIGLLQSKGQAAMGNDQDDIVVMPIATVQRRLTGNLNVGTLLVSMDDGADAEQVKADLTRLLRERRKLAESDENNFNVLDTKQLAETLSSTTQVMTTLLGAVAAVSLLVGGIGIMNIMLVSVTERTREIGIRLAIGALGHEVLMQFLIEAVVLAALGGVIGIVIATVASVGLSVAMQLPYVFDPTINILSFVFSAGIGVVFGYFAARLAARPSISCPRQVQCTGCGQQALVQCPEPATGCQSHGRQQMGIHVADAPAEQELTRDEFQHFGIGRSLGHWKLAHGFQYLGSLPQVAQGQFAQDERMGEYLASNQAVCQMRVAVLKMIDPHRRVDQDHASALRRAGTSSCGSEPPSRARRRALSRSIRAFSASRTRADFSFRPVMRWA